MATLTKVSYDVHSIDSAPEGSKPLLEQAKKNLGFVPNMYGVMAESPILLNTYLHGYEQFRKHSSFTATEQEVILLSSSRENECHYCTAAHSTLADNMSNVPKEVTDAIRNNAHIPDPKLSALSVFTRVMIQQRGFPSDDDVEAFLNAGYTKTQILEVVQAISVKTISNYANHLAETPLDKAFEGRKWEK